MFASGKTAAVASAANYVEEVFSTYLYTGNGSSQTITNGIDLSTYGGMLWLKARSAISYNLVTDSARGAGAALRTESTAANQNIAGRSFYTNGFDVNGSSDNFGNGTNTTYASWTFRKQAKFFDVVTYTGNDTAGRTIAHNLGSVPGCIIVKATNSALNWFVYHRSLGNTKSINLNLTSAATTVDNWGNTTPTSTVFTVDSGSETNQSGVTYVAYLFAHDAGGFGLTGTDNVISCGSYTEGSSDVTVSLGYEPAWILVKPSSTTGNWNIYDTMRGAALTGNTAVLRPNTSDAEANPANYWYPTSTGFVAKSGNYGSGQTIIYIAIRRGPMKVPTSGTSVFATDFRASATAQSQTPPLMFYAGFAPDLYFYENRTTPTGLTRDRLRGANGLLTTATDAETTSTLDVFGSNKGIYPFTGSSDTNILAWMFKRAPSFFDVVCYTGTGSAGATQNHNLGVVPELVILKCRSAVQEWRVMCAYYNGGSSPWSYRTALNTTGGISAGSGVFNDTAPTASVFTLGNNAEVNDNGSTYVAYLFATCAGVSKVGSYTGTGTTKQIDCGFAAGARFVLIKRTDSTGDWYVWDTARGIVSGNDPYLLLNSTAAETTGTDYIDTYSAGFEISSTAPAAINASGGTFIFLAIA